MHPFATAPGEHISYDVDAQEEGAFPSVDAAQSDPHDMLYRMEQVMGGDDSHALVVPGALPTLTWASATNTTLQELSVATLRQ